MAKRKGRYQGRIPKFTPEVAAKFCEHIASGMSRNRAADLIGVHRTTVLNWLKMSRTGKGGKLYSTFSAEVAVAEAEFIRRNLKSVEKAATPRRSEIIKRTVRNTYDLAGNPTGTSEVIETTTKRELDWAAAKWLLECKDRESFGPDRHEIQALKTQMKELEKLLREAVGRRVGPESVPARNDSGPNAGNPEPAEEPAVNSGPANSAGGGVGDEPGVSSDAT